MRASPTVLGWGVGHRTVSHSSGCTMGITILQGPWERQTRLASSSTGIAEHLLCAHHHVQVGGEDRCPPSGVLLCNAWGKCPCPQPRPLSFPTLVTTICNPLLLSTTHHPAAPPSPACLSISCPVPVEEDEAQPSFLRSLEACVFSFSHHHRQSSSGHLPSF